MTDKQPGSGHAHPGGKEKVIAVATLPPPPRFPLSG